MDGVDLRVPIVCMIRTKNRFTKWRIAPAKLENHRPASPRQNGKHGQKNQQGFRVSS